MPATRGSRLLRYGFALLAVALATALRLLLDPLLREQAPYTACFLAIALTAWYGGLGPSLAALAASAGVSTYLFVSPRGSFLVHGTEAQSALALFLLSGAVVALLGNLHGAGRRRAEGSVVSLKDSQSQLLALLDEIEKVMEVAPAAILVALDPACQRITGNRAANELYGVRGKLNFSLTPPLGEPPAPHRYFAGGKELRGAELPMQRAAAQNKEIRDLELQVIRQDGAQLAFFGGAIPLHDEHGRVRGCIAVFVDITARKKAEESLRKLSQALEQSPVSVIITDPDGNIEYVNRRFVQATGYTVAEVLGKNPRILKSGHTSEEEYRTLWQTLKAGGDWSGEFLNKAKDGSLFWERAIVTSIKNEAGQIAHLLALKEDITERKQAEEALRQERVFTNAVLDSVPGLPYLFDVDGRLVRWNKKQEEATGYSAAELAHMHITDWFRGEDVAYIAGRMAKVFAEGYADAEATLVTKDGTGIPFYFTGVRLILDGKTYLAGIGIDISALKTAEEAIRKSEMLYRTLFQSANDAIFILKHDLFSDCNAMATRMFGCSREELVGHCPAEFSPARQPDGRDSAEASLEKIRLAMDGKPQFFGWTHRRADGSLVLAEISLNRIEAYSEPTLLAIVRDVTERKKAEESLRELSQAVEQSPVNVIITDTDGNIEYVNRRFVQVTGYTAAEVLGKNPRILKSGHTPDEEYRTLWRTIKAGDDWSGEFLNKAKDGSLFWERALITSIKNEAGEVAHFLAVKEDITERKQAEEALQQMRLQLAHVARLSTLGEMAAELAHELNHPLYAILNYAKATRNVLAEEGPPDLDSVREWNEEIADIALSAAEVVKRLRSFARRGQALRSVCRVEAVAAEALGLVAVELRRARVAVETCFSAALPAVRADRVQIQQVFVNLLSNAAEAMRGVAPDMRRVAIRTSLGDAAVEVVVSDCGIGLPPEGETKIFEPYVTTKPQGLGMGLSIVRTIVEAHGGRVWATANPEGGAAFHFTLPLENGGRSNGV
jgi:two-component system NtrC family sensor kinase